MEALTQEQKLAVKQMSVHHSLFVQYSVEVSQGSKMGVPVEKRIRRAELLVGFTRDLMTAQAELDIEVVSELSLIWWEEMAQDIADRLKAEQAA